MAEANGLGDGISSFDLANISIDLSQLQVFHPTVRDGDFWLEQEGNSIYLNAIGVPEPATIWLIALGLVFFLLQKSIWRCDGLGFRRG